VYDELDGWSDDITSVRDYSDLPKEARAYVEYIQEAVSAPIGWVSVGPERSQLIEIS
jgi:adenylosuccinate synthase